MHGDEVALPINIVASTLFGIEGEKGSNTVHS